MNVLVNGEPWPEDWADDPEYLSRAWSLFKRWCDGETITVTSVPQP